MGHRQRQAFDRPDIHSGAQHRLACLADIDQGLPQRFFRRFQFKIDQGAIKVQVELFAVRLLGIAALHECLATVLQADAVDGSQAEADAAAFGQDPEPAASFSAIGGGFSHVRGETLCPVKLGMISGTKGVSAVRAG